MKILHIIGLLSCFSGFAQPNTEIYLFELSKKGISNPKNISNNEGYDNQPSFWSDSKSVLYARTVNGQTEIARYFIDTKKTDIISNTPQGGEYSPLKIPGKDAISAIRLDTTGLQLLYEYDLEGKWSVAVPDLKIGYHTWLKGNQLACFVLGDPVTLQLVNMENGEVKILKSNVGRSLHSMPAYGPYGYISILNKEKEPWTIAYLDPIKGKYEPITTSIGTGEDYCYTANGTLLMGDGNKLMKYTKKAGWELFADFSTFQINGSISRIAVSPDDKKMTIVVSSN